MKVRASVKEKSRVQNCAKKREIVRNKQKNPRFKQRQG
jgi:ribosomal protein L36